VLEARIAVVRDHTLCRVGFIVPKHGKSAVQRNQLKRRLRELIRVGVLGALHTVSARSGVDIIVRALPNAYRASFEELAVDVKQLALRVLSFVESSTDRKTGGASEPLGG
jgi:ribonuclease P protein component